jgi:hypothetical protein
VIEIGNATNYVECGRAAVASAPTGEVLLLLLDELFVELVDHLAELVLGVFQNRFQVGHAGVVPAQHATQVVPADLLGLELRLLLVHQHVLHPRTGGYHQPCRRTRKGVLRLTVGVGSAVVSDVHDEPSLKHSLSRYKNCLYIIPKFCLKVNLLFKCGPCYRFSSRAVSRA